MCMRIIIMLNSFHQNIREQSKIPIDGMHCVYQTAVNLRQQSTCHFIVD